MSINTCKEHSGCRYKILAFCFCALLFITSTGIDNLYAATTPIKGTYPNKGSLWLSSDMNYSGELYMSSNNCNTQEKNAYKKVLNSTKGKSEMPDHDDGIKMSSYNCSGSWSNDIDILLNYVTTHPTPGENSDIKNPKAYCTYFDVDYPCGNRAKIKISKAWWNTATKTSKERLIMHETGHSLGMGHLCSENSIMNDGTSGCNNGVWTAVTGYLPPDRRAIDAIY